ncbi:heavy-metal-associated domain-containing protein [Clostridium sp. SYSU_GA19001]|uniref:heavy-metal-associated domain-containing protein n=1 Tax=Clostridium caldaquaticum TaxID=2940653 RepID=UPI0020775CAC|nr:heavy-metal-associated domain-containing protein [Clostridium caldaquaticum]MCM8709652.1 heavy-metal-associated domain-containing protein [Clostridium caldaquaticum]
MKSVIKVANMRTLSDVNKIREAISNNEGVIACQISKEKQEVSIVYDTYFLKEDDIIQCLEDLGYTII